MRCILSRLLLIALVLAPPLAAQVPSTREIAAAAHAATVTVEALGPTGARTGAGSGFFVRRDGAFVTNYHVVEGASKLRVRLPDGDTYENVFLITADPTHDLVVLRIPVDDVPALPLGRDVDLRMGDPVYVMGNPLGMERTFSDGLVSAHRTYEGIRLVQITAPISPGSSGGPVLNAKGEVIGVATLTLREGQNLNMAMPVRYVRPLLTTGEAPRRFAAALVPQRSVAPPRVARSTDERSRAADGMEEFVAQSLGQIRRVGSRLISEFGMSLSHELQTGYLEDEEGEWVTIRLTRGRQYAFVGACDEDCADLDLGIADGDGTMLSRDVELDDHPVVTHTPRYTGEYRLYIRMARCHTEPCAYAIGAFER